MAVPITPIRLGDVVKLKKAHPCGANEWEIERVGMDVVLRCRGCDRKVRLIRYEFDRRFRGFVGRPTGPAPTEQAPAEDGALATDAQEDGTE